MKVQTPLMGVGGWYEYLAAGWLADMRSKQVPTSITSARRLAAINRPLTGESAESKPSDEEEDRGGSPLGPGGPFSCSQCRGAYPTREQLERHETLHLPSTQVDNVKYTCKICHKSFLNVYRLQRHMISHDDSAALRKYKCNDCDKAFKFKHHLKEHLRIHSGEKPFECANCGKRFSHSGSYSSHMTSKKCLVMNLKMGRIKPNNPALNPDRSPSRKRSNIITGNPMNNNIVSNGNGFLPILPKYSEAAAFFSSMASQDNNFHRPPLSQPGINPFYTPPGMPMSPATGITPYSFPASLSQLFDQIAAQQYQYQQKKIEFLRSEPGNITFHDPEIPIEEITEEEDKKSEGSAELVMDIEDEDVVSVKQEQEIPTDTREFNSNYQESSKSGRLPLLLKSSKSLNRANFIVSQNNIYPLPDDENNLSLSSPKLHRIIRERLKTNLKSEKDDQEWEKNKEFFEPEVNVVEQEDGYNCEKDELDDSKKLLESEIKPCLNIFRKHEGLAAQMAETAALNRIEAEMRDDREEKGLLHDSDRKNRVRTALSEEQQKLLKEYYSINPRPNREEFKKIALETDLNNRVVQVWFQNNRAKVRRMTSHAMTSDQPLDLSTKKCNASITSSPSPSPTCSISATHSDSEEAVNLSQKSSRSTTPHRSNYLNTYPHSNCSSSSHTEFRLSPLPGEVTNSHKRHALNKLQHNSLISMDKIVHYNGIANGISPILNMNLSMDHPKVSSPSYERPTWGEDMTMQNEYDDESLVLKKSKVKAGNELKEGEGQFVCDQCDKTFVKQSSLARHKYEHSGQRPYKCVECPKAFKHKHHLTEHKRLHTGEKPFQCCKCLKKFSHSGSYSQHMNHRFAICKPYRD